MTHTPSGGAQSSDLLTVEARSMRPGIPVQSDFMQVGRSLQRVFVLSSGAFPLVDGFEAFCFGGFSALGFRTSLFDFC